MACGVWLASASLLLGACTLDAAGTGASPAPAGGSSSSAGGAGGAGTGGAGGLGAGGLGGGGDGGGGGPAAPFCDPTDPTLVACFRFDGSLADESMTSLVPDVAAGFQYATGHEGQAIAMDNATQLRLPYHPSWEVTHVTIEAWIHPASLPQGDPEDTSPRAAILDSQSRYSLFLYPGSQIQCDAGVIRKVAGIQSGVWNHIACVSDGATQKLYLNGVAIDSAPGVPVPHLDPYPTHIGSNHPDFADGFEGLLDGLRVWSVPRTASQICEAAGRSGC